MAASQMLCAQRAGHCTPDIDDEKAHANVIQLLWRHDRVALVHELEALAERLVTALSTAKPSADASRLQTTLACLRLRVPALRDPARSLELAHNAVEGTRRRDSDALAILAEAQHATGDPRRAVITLVDTLTLGRGSGAHDEQLAAYREELSPDLVSFTSIDAALSSRPCAVAKDAELYKAFVAAAHGEHVGCRSYLEARLEQRAGRVREAAVRFAAIAASVPGDPARLTFHCPQPPSTTLSRSRRASVALRLASSTNLKLAAVTVVTSHLSIPPNQNQEGD